MMIHVTGHDPADFGAGLEVAARLSDVMPQQTPKLLRSAASCLEAKATTAVELGTACGLRLIAGSLEDAIAHHPSSGSAA